MPKKIINNGNFIAELAPLIDSPAAAKLAKAAEAYSNIIGKFGIIPTFDGFDGCEQAQLLVKWIADPTQADEKQMEQWTTDIMAAIDEMAHGKDPESEE